jgi:hypothetical protein
MGRGKRGKMGFWVQVVLAVTIAVVLIVLYWGFRSDLLLYLMDHLGQAVILILIYLIVYAQVGGALGVPYLFWNEEPVTRFFASVGCTLLLALLGINAYYLIPEDQHVKVMRRINDFLGRWSILKLPFGGWLEPKKGNAVELSRFLRAARFPFLVLLLLPALLPLVFSNVPRYAPVFTNHPKSLLIWTGLSNFFSTWKSQADVSAHVPAYLIGLAVWAAGLVTGVVLVKLAIKATCLLNPLTTRVDAIVFPRVRRVAKRLDGLLGGPSTRSLAPRIPHAKLNSIITFFVVVVLCYAALSTVFFESYDFGIFEYRGVAPAFAICALLGILAMASSALKLMRPRYRLWAVALALVWIGWANNDPFKLRFENLPYYSPKDKPVVLTEASVLQRDYESGSRSSTLADESQVLPRWARFAQENSANPERKPKLAVVCVSGGATRSAYWSAVVLDRLEQGVEQKVEQGVDPKHTFHNHVRVIAGASGGMVGTAYYVKWLYDQHPKSNPLKRSVWPAGQNRWYSHMPIYSLRKVARSLALRETWRMFFPRWWKDVDDRGNVLEKDWKDLCKISFSDLQPLEVEGELPSLIFSPMTVDDGRQLLISNLESVP